MSDCPPGCRVNFNISYACYSESGSQFKTLPLLDNFNLFIAVSSLNARATLRNSFQVLPVFYALLWFQSGFYPCLLLFHKFDFDLSVYLLIYLFTHIFICYICYFLFISYILKLPSAGTPITESFDANSTIHDIVVIKI